MRPLATLRLSSLPQEFVASLPAFAVVGLLALIWLACAVVATVGIYFAGMVFCAARWLVSAYRRAIAHHWKPTYAHLVTIDSTGVTMRLVTARGARRWHIRSATTDATANREPGTGRGVQPDTGRRTGKDSDGESS